jgi:formate dehydrogenase assembly factor FdhD
MNMASDHQAKNSSECGTCGKEDCQAKNRQPQESQEDFLDRQKLESRMCRIGRKIVVLSGKGGVG